MKYQPAQKFGYRRLTAILGAAIAVAFATTTARCADQKPLGAIAQTAGAQVNGVSALDGSRVYSGDVVETSTAGALHLRLGSGRLLLSASSEVSLEQHGKLATVTLQKGSATFSLPDPLQFELETPAGTLRGSGTQSTSGEVEIFGSSQMVVTASKGDLILDNDGELHVIPQGRSYRITIEQDAFAIASSERAPKPKRAHRHRKLLFFLLAPGGTVAALIPF